MRNVFDELNKIGQVEGKPALIKVAQAGHNLVNLSVGISGVCSQLEKLSGVASASAAAGTAMPALASFMGPIAAFQPAFLIVSAGVALASLCGLGKRKKKNKEDPGLKAIIESMRVIHEAVVEVHKAVIEVHGAVIEVHKAVIEVHGAVIDVHKAVIEVYDEVRKVSELIYRLADYLIEDVQYPILEGIGKLDDNVQALQIISGLEHRELYLHKLSDLVNRLSHVKKDNMDENEIKKIIRKLEGWARNTSCGNMLTGRDFAKTGAIANKPEWIKQVLSNPNNNVNNLIGYLAIRADAPGIDQALLMNLPIWSEAVKNYLAGLEHINLNKFDPDSDLKNMQLQIKNYLAFIEFASSNEDLYKNLFDNYSECIIGINKTIDNRFNELRANHSQTISGSTLEQIFPEKSGARVKLEYWLDALDDFHLLFSAYAQLGGITKLYEGVKKDLLTREKILAYKYDFLDHTIQGPGWSDATGFSQQEAYETIRTNVFKLNGKDIFAGLVRQSGGMTIDLYDLKTNKPLEGLPERKNKDVYPKWSKNLHPNAHIYYRTIRATVMYIQNQPKIFIMAMHSAGFEIFSYDPVTNSWIKLPDAPLGITNGHEVINLDLYSAIVNGEPRLYQIVVTKRGSQLNVYDPIAKTPWQKAVNIPHLKTNNFKVNACCSGGYVLEKNGRQYLCFLSQGEGRKIRIDEYDLVNNVFTNTVMSENSLPDDHDFSTMRAQILTVNGTQKLYISMWVRSSSRIKVMMYDPIQNKIDFVCDGPKWKSERISIYRSQAIQINGVHKLLAMVLQPSKGLEKHLFDPQAGSWKHSVISHLSLIMIVLRK